MPGEKTTETTETEGILAEAAGGGAGKEPEEQDGQQKTGEEPGAAAGEKQETQKPEAEREAKAEAGAGTGAATGDSLLGAFAPAGPGPGGKAQPGAFQLPQDVQQRLDKLEDYYKQTVDWLPEMMKEKTGGAGAGPQAPAGGAAVEDLQTQTFPSRYDPDKQPELWINDQIAQNVHAQAGPIAERIVEERMKALEDKLDSKDRSAQEEYQRAVAMDESLNLLATDPRTKQAFAELEGDIKNIVLKSPGLKQLDPKEFGPYTFMIAFCRKLMTNPDFALKQVQGMSQANQRNLATKKEANVAGGEGGGTKTKKDGGAPKKSESEQFIEDLSQDVSEELRKSQFFSV